ncbi:MAG: hypothetical protein JW759_02695 [Candidatus Coatesbacteria bacterium]|nr:hypothetical protein [Candidatus Coatesbacteria bacterium]
MGKACILMVLGLAISLSFLIMGAHERGSDAVSNSSDLFSMSNAANLAHSAANVALSTITSDPSWTSPATARNLGGGTCSASCVREPASVNSRIAATGTYLERTHNVEVLVQTRPPNLRSAITANPPVQTFGTLTVDGRDRDEDGNVIPGQGGLAVECSQSVTRGGSSVFGGTNEYGQDFAPTASYDPSIVNAFATFDGGFPTSPDAVVGLPDGSLKAYAMSGANGSQYTTNPATLTMPLRGVTFVELGSGTDWNSGNFTGGSSGILVVHSAARDAVLKNFYGSFCGIVIADDVDKIHGTIIGNVTVIGDVATGNCIGNGEGSVLYSSHYIFDALGDLPKPDLKILSWWE